MSGRDFLVNTRTFEPRTYVLKRSEEWFMYDWRIERGGRETRPDGDIIIDILWEPGVPAASRGCCCFVVVV